MKTLKELIAEGGNVFSGTQSIKKEYIEETVSAYLDELGKIFPKKKKWFSKKYFKYVGSVGKKPVSGDIDFAVDSSTIVDSKFSDKSIKMWDVDPKSVKELFEKYKKRARSAKDSEIMMRSMLKHIVDRINIKSNILEYDPKKVTAGNVFGKYPQIHKGKPQKFGVQMDWMVGNLEWLTFSYYSNVYKNNVKGLHRTQLLLSMFQNLDMSFNHIKGVTDKKTGEKIASNPKEAIKLLETKYKHKFPASTIDDYYGLMGIVNKLPKKDYDNIINIFLGILDRTRADIPEDLQNEWVRRKKKLKLTGKFLPKDSALRSLI